MFKRLTSAGLLFGVLATAPPAFASACGLRENVVDRLQSQYSEALTAGGLQAGRNVQTVVEVWASEETGTFTVMLTNARGVSCIVATGTDFFTQAIEAEPEGLKS